MIVVGVAGKYCTGKSTVSDLLAEHGYAVIDVDRTGHEALAREAEAVVEAFGDEVRQADGSVDRRTLGRIVFADEQKLRRLESIVHPAMVEMVADEVERIRAGVDRRPVPPGIVINAAILFRMKLHPLCDEIVYVTAPFLQIVRRARERDGAGLLEVIRRLRSQRDVDPQFSAPNADTHSVENDGDREHLRSQLEQFLPLP